MITYIDLFCGIGGFHQGMDRVANERNFHAECIFAADNNKAVSNIYKLNYGIDCLYDLKSNQTHKIIDERIGNKKLMFLFGGFPCQPFSKAGLQEGFNNQMKGTLFFEIKKIIHRHKPIFVLLENVRNLKGHDNGNTWNLIKKSLEYEGYFVDDVILSPNNIKSIPALRERFFILAYNRDIIKIDENKMQIKKKYKTINTSIYPNGLKERGLNKKYFIPGSDSDLEDFNIRTIEMWNDLHRMLKMNGKKLISPLWPHYFSKNIDLSDVPEWKIKIINRNQQFYSECKDIYDKWYKKHQKHFESLCLSDRKFEWNVGDDIDDIWEGLIQFRPSGVRVKRPDYIPTLVTLNQTPIIGTEKRYLRYEEMAKLYGFKGLKFGDQSPSESRKQLGNTVSVDVIEYLINHMLNVSKLKK